MDYYIDLESNPGIDTIALPQQEEYFTGNPDCWITGFGQTNGPYTPYLQEARVDVYSRDYCDNIYHNQGPYHVCVGKKGKSTACFGDSGGPLVCRKNGVWYLVGAASWTAGGCNANMPATYARVAHVVDWIKSHTGQQW